MILPRLPRVAAVLAVAVLALAGCAPSTMSERGSSDGEGVVGVALPTADDLAMQRLGAALEDELDGRGYRVDLEYAANDDRTQASQVQNMVTKGEDAVVLVPLTADVLEGARAAADAAGVVLVAAGRAVDAAAVVEASDPAAVGRAQAEALLDALATRDAGPRVDADARDDAAADRNPTPGSAAAEVALLTGVADDPDAAVAYAAATEALESAVAAGTVRIVAGADLASAAVSETPGDIEGAAETRVRTLRGASDGESPDALLALGDAVSRGVVTALTTPDPDATPSPSPTAAADPDSVSPVPPVVVTSGGDAVTVRALRDGIVDATVFTDTREWAVPIADAVVAALGGEEPTPTSVAAPTTVDRDAVESVFLETGWLRAEDLDD